MVPSIAPSEVEQLLQGGAELIDVRTPVEFAEAHVLGAQNLPLDRLDPKTLDSESSYVVLCRSGSRGRTACQKLMGAGFERVVNVDGGTLACIESGLGVRRGKGVMSLERQVRIAAGSLVLVGVALGWWVHPGWIGLSAFVGAGLVFAGLTDTCGMGMLLARMPWNQRV